MENNSSLKTHGYSPDRGNPTYLLSSAIPFPPLSWWRLALRTGNILLDPQEYYQKMSFRNRYYLAGPQGKQLLSLPLEKGRNQRLPMNQVRMDTVSRWKINHWRTLVSLYGRSPFFEHFSETIQSLFQDDYEMLFDWNLKALELVSRLFNWDIRISEAESFQKSYPENYIDIRHRFLPKKLFPDPARYHQVFEDRTGFIADCSILDLLFCEGLQGGSLLLSPAPMELPKNQ
jgi:hypothetical protein